MLQGIGFSSSDVFYSIGGVFYSSDDVFCSIGDVFSGFASEVFCCVCYRFGERTGQHWLHCIDKSFRSLAEGLGFDPVEA